MHEPSGTFYPTKLGSPAAHTVYEAELVGIRLAALAARRHRTPHHQNFWFFIDNQASIRALSQRFCTSPALSLRVAARQALTDLLETSPSFAISLVWCPAHVGIHENEAVDVAAKEAATNGEPLCLPTSLAALRQRINAARKASITEDPSPAIARRLRGVHDPFRTRKALMSLPRPDATAIAQLRANHSPLSHFLHRIGVIDSPNCDHCPQAETTEHFVLICREYSTARKALFASLRRLKVPRTLQAILTTPQAFQPLATYVRETGRFEHARRWRPPAPTPSVSTSSHPPPAHLPGLSRRPSTRPSSQPSQPSPPASTLPQVP